MSQGQTQSVLSKDPSLGLFESVSSVFYSNNQAMDGPDHGTSGVWLRVLKQIKWLIKTMNSSVLSDTFPWSALCEPVPAVSFPAHASLSCIVKAPKNASGEGT